MSCNYKVIVIIAQVTSGISLTMTFDYVSSFFSDDMPGSS